MGLLEIPASTPLSLTRVLASIRHLKLVSKSILSTQLVIVTCNLSHSLLS